jgi:hypothetical protein
VVVESPEEIVEQMTYTRARAIALAARLAAGTMADDELSRLGVSPATQPLPAVGRDLGAKGR